MSNAEEYYHSAYNVHTEQLVSLRKQVKLLEEVLELSDLQAEIVEAIRVGDTGAIEAAKQKYEDHKKLFNKISRKLAFWKTVAIIESGIIVGLTTTVLILTYL